LDKPKSLTHPTNELSPNTFFRKIPP
jgi:hypothetical protein